MGKVISFINLKGGTGKTSISTNFSCVLMKKGYKVLHIDFDGQANSSLNFGIVDYNNRTTIIDLLKTTQRKIKYPEKKDYIVNCECGVDCIPCNSSFFNLTKDLLQCAGSEFLLRKFIKNEKLKDMYDFIVIDNNPGLGVTYENAIIASDYLIIPCEADAFSFQGMFSLLTSLNEIINNEDLNCETKIAGILINKDKPKTIVSQEVKENLLKNINVQTYETSIPHSEEIRKAQLESNITILQKPNCSASKAFNKFVEEFLCNMK